MRIFVTGATGFIGSAVVQELVGAGHEVVGLARSEQAAESLRAKGAEVHLGSLEDLDRLREGAAGADGVIHLAFIHDFLNFEKAAETDRLAIEAMGEALEGTGKPFVGTSGVLMLPSGRLGTEEDDPLPITPRRSEQAALKLNLQGVRSSVIRLAPSVHGAGDQGFVKTLIQIARDKGVSAYIGDGDNCWPAVHRFDAARLYRLAIESGLAGARLHGVAEEGICLRDLAGIIGRCLNLPVVSITREEAERHFGWIAFAAAADNRSSSEQTRKLLGWQPTHAGLLQDLEEGHYFHS